jgi:hypothetical protein
MAIVRLRTTTDAHLDFVKGAESDPDTGPFIVPWPRHRHAIALGDPDIAHRIAEDEAQNPVGFVILGGLTNPDSSIEFRRIVVVRKGQGYGRSIVRAVKELAFNELRAHRLWLDVKAQTRAHAPFTRARGSPKRACSASASVGLLASNPWSSWRCCAMNSGKPETSCCASRASRTRGISESGCRGCRCASFDDENYLVACQPA